MGTDDYNTATLQHARAIAEATGDWPESVFEGPHALALEADKNLERFAREIVRLEAEAELLGDTLREEAIRAAGEADAIGRLVDTLISVEIGLLLIRTWLPWVFRGTRRRIAAMIDEIEKVLAATPDRKFQQRVMRRIRIEEQRP